MAYKIKKGATRWVFLTHRYAIKIPSLYSFRALLTGMLANMQEIEFSKCEDFKGRLCPVLFSLPLGILIVMPRAEEIKIGDRSRAELWTFCFQDKFPIPAEMKHDSFGVLNGELVAIDYGP